MIKKIFAKIIYRYFQIIFTFIAKNSNEESLLLTKIINFLNISIGKGFSGPETLHVEIKSLLNFFSPEDRLILIDAGAHRGKYSEIFKNLFPLSKVYCFEPSKINFEHLENKFINDETVEIKNLGLSDKNTSAELFFDTKGSSMSSVYNRKLDHFNINFDNKELIELVDLDSFWKKNNKNINIDILKLDIEGNELLALNGCGSLINTIKIIQFEFGGCNIDSKTYFQDFWYFFEANNFSIYRVTPHKLIKLTNYKEEDEYFKTTVFIAANNSLI